MKTCYKEKYLRRPVSANKDDVDLLFLSLWWLSRLRLCPLYGSSFIPVPSAFINANKEIPNAPANKDDDDFLFLSIKAIAPQICPL